MASTRRKSAAIALAVVGVAGLSLAAAARLMIESSQLAAGSVVVTGCDTAVAVDYTVSGSDVTHVVLSDVADVCNGADYSIQLLTGPNDALVSLGAAATGTRLTVVEGAATVPLGTENAQPVASVTGIAIVLS